MSIVTVSDECSKEVFVSLEGRAFDAQSRYGSVYKFVENGTFSHWRKNNLPSGFFALSAGQAIWFDRDLGRWHIGKIEDLWTDDVYIASFNGSSCPHFPENQWYFYDGTNYRASEGSIKVVPWTNGTNNLVLNFVAS